MMKRIFYMLAAVSAFVVGCRDSLDSGHPIQEVSGLAFVARTESAPLVKSVMAPDPDRGGVYNVKWVKGDEVLVSDGQTSAVYFAFPDKDETSATLTSIASQVPSKNASSYYAVYPAEDGAVSDDGICTVLIPEVQNISDNGIMMPMVGRAGADRVLSFRNAASLIRIRPSHSDLYDGMKIVRVEVLSETMNIAGPVEFTFDDEGIPYVRSTLNGSPKVVLDCGEGMPFTENFFVAVAPGTYGDLTVTLHTNGGGSQSFTIEEKEYRRSNYTTVSVLTTDLAIYEPANCYLVRKPGTYSFPVNVKGNGVLVPGSTITSAEIDVETIKGVSVDVISQLDLKVSELSADYSVKDVTMQGDRIFFNVPSEFTPGNIRIGVYSTENCDAGTCIWQWHIWANPDVSELASSGVRLMNMNLGSLQNIANLSEYAGTNAGLHYQWGRKDPFHAAVLSEDEEETVLSEIQSSLGYSVNENCTNVSQNRSTLKNAIAYPTVFYTGKKQLSSSKSERYAWNDTDCEVALWGAPTVKDVSVLDFVEVNKTMFDPCPPGYHVPEARALKEAKALLPADGYRLVPNDKTIERLDRLGEQKYYWSASSFESDGMNGVALGNGSPAKRTKSYAMPIRPQKQ